MTDDQLLPLRVACAAVVILVARPIVVATVALRGLAVALLMLVDDLLPEEMLR